MSRPVAVALLAVLVTSPAHAVETLRIVMEQSKGAIEVRASQLWVGPDVEGGGFEAIPAGVAKVAIERDRMLVNGSAVGTDRVRFRAGPSSRELGREPIIAGPREVRGDVVVLPGRNGLTLVNVIALEDYLTAMVGSEMPASFPLEALKAQAVAARTYALHKKLRAYGQVFHLGSSVLDQVYDGVSREDPRTRAAVEATRGEVLTFDLEPAETYFHASCGGRTETGQDALGRPLPYLKAVTCGCGKLPTSHWRAELSPAEVRRLLGAPGGRVGVEGRTSTGRVRWLTTDGRRKLDAVTFRQRAGYRNVKSLAFEVTAKGETLQLEGRGYGHGAGLCQWGAKVAADQGWDHRRILSHYYPGTELQRLY